MRRLRAPGDLMTIWPIVLVLGFAIGLVVGRWWALIAAFAFGAYLWRGTATIDAPRWVLPVGYGGIAAIGIAAGVLLRKLTRKRNQP